MIRMDYMNFVFICSQNKRRSLTAEKIFDGVNGHRAYSAGTENNARIKVTVGLLSRADIIFCMEKKHIRRIRHKFGDIICNKRSYVLIFRMNTSIWMRSLLIYLKVMLLNISEYHIWMH